MRSVAMRRVAKTNGEKGVQLRGRKRTYRVKRVDRTVRILLRVGE